MPDFGEQARDAMEFADKLYPKGDKPDSKEWLLNDIAFYSRYSKNTTDALLEQVAASRAHATRLGKLADARKEQIKELQEKVAFYEAAHKRYCDVVEWWEATDTEIVYKERKANND